MQFSEKTEYILDALIVRSKNILALPIALRAKNSSIIRERNCLFVFFREKKTKLIINSFYYLIVILCNFNLNPSNSDRTPERAESNTTFVIVYKYGFADSPEIL